MRGKPAFMLWRIATALLTFGLVACGGGGNSSDGGGNPPAPNAAPTNVKLVEVSSSKAGELVASWLPASDDITPANSLRYELHASIAADFVPSGATRIYQGTGANSATVSTGLTPGAQYTVRLVAIDALGLQTQSSSLTLRISSVDTVVRGDVKVLTLADSAVQTVSANQVTLLPGAAAPAVNEYISSGTGNGYLRRVTAVATTGGQPVLTTRDASISEVISDVSVASQFRMVTIPKEITSQASGLSVRAAGADGQRVQILWPDSRLRYEGLRSALGGTETSTRKTRLSAPAQGGTTYEQGRWAKLGAPGFVQVAEGQEVAFDLIATLTDRSDPLIGERRKICKVEFSAISTEDAAGQPGKISLSAGAIRSTQSETDPYRVISGSFPVTLRASIGAASPKAYKVTARLRIEELSQDCDNQTFWDETVEREVLIFAVNDATTFEKEEIPEKLFEGTGDFKVTNNIDMVFSPVLTFEHRLAGAELQYALIKLDATPRVEQTLTVKASAEGTVDTSHVIVPFRKFYKVYMAGSVPIVISGEYQVDMRIKGSVTGALDATERLTLGYEELSYGLQYQDGAYGLVKNIKPIYRLSMGGQGKAKAELEVSLEPQLKLTVYEALSGRILLKPYVTAEAGVEGHVQMDTEFDFNEQQVNMAADADYRLTSGNLKSGVKVFLGADLTIWKATLAAWPEKDKLQEYDLIPATTILGIPDLVAAADPVAAYATNTRAVRFVATATPVPNLLKVIYPAMADTLIPWRAFTNPRVVPVVGRDPAHSIILATTDPAGTAWVDFKQPGIYVLRQGGYSSIGTWARQYTETTLEVVDRNDNGIMDYWEERYGLQGPGAVIAAADPDGDGATNLQEWQAGTDPNKAELPPGVVMADPQTATVLQAIQFWITEAVQAVASVVWNFGVGVAEQVAAVSNGISSAVSQAFESSGVKSVVATFKDAAGTVLGTRATAVTVLAAGPVVTSVSPLQAVAGTTHSFAVSGRALPDGLRFQLSGCDSTAEVVGGTTERREFSCAFPQTTTAGNYDGTVALSDSPFGAPPLFAFTVNVRKPSLGTIAPSSTTRTLATSFEIAGQDLPISGLTVVPAGDSRGTCQTPNNVTGSGFGVACELYKVGAQLLEVRQGSAVLGSVTVNVASNVTGVTWTSPSTSSSGTVKFGETVTFKVAGTNLLADTAMGFAVEKCGVSNTEIGVPTDTSRTFTCNFNNDAGAVAGQMPGVVKDAPGGQVLLDGWNVPVEVAAAPTGDLSADFSATQNPSGQWSYGWAQSLGSPFVKFIGNLHPPIYGPLPDLKFWSDTESQSFSLVKNVGANTVNYGVGVPIPSQAVAFHPGLNAEKVIGRWTAAASGSVQVQVTFTLIDAGSVDVHVQRNGSDVFADALVAGARTTSSATLTLAVQVGDTVDFVVGEGGNGHGRDSTIVSAKVTARPATSRGKLTDTGITASQCYEAGSHTLVSCSSASALALSSQQDGMLGRDADPATNDNADGKLGFSYSEVPGFARTDCVKDNVTGLMWEGKTADGGLRDRNRTYTNYGDGRAGDSSAYVVAVNALSLCGHSDWRLPTVQELQSLVNYGNAVYPGTVDLNWFVNLTGNQYWSSLPLASDARYAWVLGQWGGDISTSPRSNGGAQLILVRAVTD